MVLMSKRLLAIIVACLITVGMCAFPVYANDNDFTAECVIEESTCSIKGKGNSDYINAVIMPADESIDNLSVQKLNQANYISFSMKNNNGFAKSFTLPQNFSNNEYKSVLWDGAEKLELYFMVGSDSFKNELISSKIKDDKLDEVVSRYAPQYNIDKPEYSELKPEVKASVSRALKEQTITNFEVQYKESVLNASFELLETADEVYNVLIMLETDFTYFNKLSDDEQQAVLSKLLKNLPDTQKQLKSRAETYSKEAYSEHGSAAKPGSGSGGGKTLGPASGNVVATIKGTPQDAPGTSNPSAPVQGLQDISDHWAKDNISTLVKMGVVSGNGDGNFYPDKNITRAEFAKMLAGVIKAKATNDLPQKFADVIPEAWYYGYVMSLYQMGIMNGYTEESFGPGENITRQEMAAAIYRVLAKYEITMENEATFADFASVSEYAKEAVLKLGGVDIITGSDGFFRPVDKLTRAEAATVMLRIYSKIASDSEIYSSQVMQNESVNMQTLLVTTQITKKEARLAEARMLIPKLLGRDMRGITRAGFISDVYDLAINIEAAHSEQLFKDLPLSRAEAASVQSAVDCAMADKAEAFYPDDAVSGYDAIRAMVCALGYKEYAEAAGGWPAGYIRAAEDAELFYTVSKSVATANALDEESACIMLLNMLQSKVIMTSGSSDGKLQLVADENTLLEKMFGIYKSTGIVKETNINSLVRTGVNLQKTVIIGDETYTADEDDDYISYLGYHVNAYYNEDGELFMLAKTEKNKLASFPADGTVMSENLKITYKGENDTRLYKYNLSEDYFFLYNGALSKKAPQSVLSETSEGTIELLDNDADGSYDIMTIKKPEYVLVDSISKINRLIYDKNSSENVIDTSDDEAVFSFEGRSGDIRFLDISPDEIYEIYATEDKKLIEMKLMSNRLAGNASARTADTITINGADYKTTQYFDKYYSERMTLGRDYSFVLSSAGKIIGFSDSVKETRPGYIVSADSDKKIGNDSLVIKMFTQKNKFETFTAENRVTVDGEVIKVSELYDMLIFGGTVNDQLVYYRTDDSGKIKAIDFSEVNVDGEYGEIKKENNSLTEYKFNTSTFLYRSNGELMYPSFNASGSTVFIVPNDKSKEEGYKVTNSSFFMDNTNYSNMKVYNLSKSGSAEVIVIRSDNPVPPFSSTHGSLVIERVQNAQNEDDEFVKKISGWVDKQYKSYLLDSSISPYKASGEELGFGDVIRFQAEGDEIKSMVCDFDANESVFARNDVSDASEMNGGYKNFMYQFGEAYYLGDDHIYIGGGEDGRDLSNSALRNFSANTTNIAIIDMNEKTVRTGTVADIKTYKNSGSGDFVLMRQRNLLTMAIYVYVK